MGRLADVRLKQVTVCGSEGEQKALGTTAWISVRRIYGVQVDQVRAKSLCHVRGSIRRRETEAQRE